MSTSIKIQDNSELPCTDWDDSEDENDDCPMMQKWLEGDSVICFKCGYVIEYDSDEPH